MTNNRAATSHAGQASKISSSLDAAVDLIRSFEAKRRKSRRAASAVQTRAMRSRWPRWVVTARSAGAIDTLRGVAPESPRFVRDLLPGTPNKLRKAAYHPCPATAIKRPAFPAGPLSIAQHRNPDAAMGCRDDA